MLSLMTCKQGNKTPRYILVINSFCEHLSQPCHQQHTANITNQQMGFNIHQIEGQHKNKHINHSFIGFDWSHQSTKKSCAIMTSELSQSIWHGTSWHAMKNQQHPDYFSSATLALIFLQDFWESVLVPSFLTYYIRRDTLLQSSSPFCRFLDVLCTK